MRLVLLKRSKPQARHAAGDLVNDFAGAARFASAGARPWLNPCAERSTAVWCPLAEQPQGIGVERTRPFDIQPH
jgi:hypothetical protein